MRPVPKYSPFELRRRRVARISLYGSLILVGLAVAGFWRLLDDPSAADRDMTWHEVDWEDEPELRLLQQYLRVDTSPSGDELAGALFLSTPLRAAGVSPEIVALGPRRANLRAVLPGRREEQLVLLSHLDVEPVEGTEGWDHPPFAGVVVGPMIWGRGAFDMKSYTVAQLWAFLETAGRPELPERTLTLLATSEEEQGSHLGLRWTLWQRPEWFEDVWAVVTEGGLVEARSLSEPKYWAIETGQEIVIFFEACAGSRERLEAFREDIRGVLRETIDDGVFLTEPVEEFWQEYWPSRDTSTLREALASPEDLARDRVALRELPGYLRNIVSNDLDVGPVRRSPEGGWVVRMALSLVPGADPEREIERLLPPWLTGGLSVTRTEPEAFDGVSSVDHPVYRGLAERLREESGGAPVGPFVISSVITDSRLLRARGIPSYGFTPFLMLTPETMRAANRNEKIPAPAFSRGVALYTETVRDLLD